VRGDTVCRLKHRLEANSCPVPRLTLLFFGAAKTSGSSRNGGRRDNYFSSYARS
jgi:hypothetical protein